MPSTQSQMSPEAWAKHITYALGGRWFAGYGKARCPAHDDRNPSLSIRGGHRQIQVKCHTGCDPVDVIDALKQRGLWPHPARSPLRQTRTSRLVSSKESTQQYARTLWDQAVAFEDTVASGYLEHRGIKAHGCSELRFLPHAKHGPSQTHWPCLLAAIRSSDGQLQGVHRTFLNTKPLGKAPLEDPRLSLGKCRGHAIHLQTPTDGLVGLAEGLETAASASQLFGVPVWAALSTENLWQQILSPSIKQLIIFADNGGPGHAAAVKATNAYSAAGRGVTVQYPPEQFGDFNDLLCADA